MTKAGISYREEALPISRFHASPNAKELTVVMCNVKNIMRNYSFIFIYVKFALDTLINGLSY